MLCVFLLMGIVHVSNMMHRFFVYVSVWFETLLPAFSCTCQPGLSPPGVGSPLPTSRYSHYHRWWATTVAIGTTVAVYARDACP